MQPLPRLAAVLAVAALPACVAPRTAQPAAAPRSAEPPVAPPAASPPRGPVADLAARIGVGTDAAFAAIPASSTTVVRVAPAILRAAVVAAGPREIDVWAGCMQVNPNVPSLLWTVHFRTDDPRDAVLGRIRDRADALGLDTTPAREDEASTVRAASADGSEQLMASAPQAARGAFEIAYMTEIETPGRSMKLGDLSQEAPWLAPAGVAREIVTAVGDVPFSRVGSGGAPLTEADRDPVLGDVSDAYMIDFLVDPAADDPHAMDSIERILVAKGFAIDPRGSAGDADAVVFARDGGRHRAVVRPRQRVLLLGAPR